MNKLKLALKNNEVSFGAWIQIGHPAIAEILANNGFDWICIDLEHGVIDIETMTNIFRAIEKYNCVPIVRIPVNDPVWIHRVLDAGAKGLIIPMINNSKDAQKAVEEAKYPPIGKRSFGYSRSNLYGENFNKYVKNINNEIIIILQIEHVSAINNLEDILAVEGFDGTLIGPYDLSGSMGIVGEFDNIKFKEVLDKYLNLSKLYDKKIGIHVVRPTKENIKEVIKKGYKFIALGTDAVFLEEKSKKILEFRKINETEL